MPLYVKPFGGFLWTWLDWIPKSWMVKEISPQNMGPVWSIFFSHREKLWKTCKTSGVWKDARGLGYIGEYTTQLYKDYNKPQGNPYQNGGILGGAITNLEVSLKVLSLSYFWWGLGGSASLSYFCFLGDQLTSPKQAQKDPTSWRYGTTMDYPWNRALISRGIGCWRWLMAK